MNSNSLKRALSPVTFVRLMALFLAGPSEVGGQQCRVHALPIDERQVYRDDAASVTLIFPAGMGIDQNVSSAAVGWNGACHSLLTTVPALSALAVPGRPGFPGEPTRPALNGMDDSILITWLQNTTARYRDPQNPTTGGLILAEWIRPQPGVPGYMNQILLYGKTPNGNPIGWGDPALFDTIMHEVAHALGLAHDAGCPATNLMTPDYPFGATIMPAHCATVNNIQKPICAGSSSPIWEPGAVVDTSCPAGCDCSVDPISPIENLYNRCQVNPYLCEEPGQKVWWNSPLGRPTQVCTEEMTCTDDVSRCPQDPAFPTNECCIVKHVCRWVWEPDFEPLLSSQRDLAIALSQPVSGATVKGFLVVRGVALQASPGVRAVTFWVDNQRVAVTNYVYGLPAGTACNGWTDPSCPNVGFSATLDTQLLSNGSHLLQVVADDRATITPEVALLSVPIVVSNCVSTRSPTAVLTAPTAGSTLQGTVTLTATASDDGRIDRVEFFVNETGLATDQTSPYSKTWNTVGFPNGSVALTAKAYDMCGNVGVSASVTATVSNPVPNNPPQVWIDAPAQNANVTTRNLAVYGWATDSGGVPSFTFTVDGQPRVLIVSRGPRTDVCNAVPVGDPNCPNVGWGVTLDTYGLAAGAHTIAATAIDNLGATATVSRTFQIVNAAPSAWVGYPTLGRTVSGAALSVVGHATDTDGVESVRLEIDNQPVTLLAPWSRLPASNVCAAGSPLDPNCPNVGYKLRFNSTAYQDGVHSLRIVVRDTRGLEVALPHSLVFRNNPVGTRVTRPAAADTFIRSALPTSTAGGTTTLLYANGTSTDLKYTFLRFDLSGISGQLVAARLNLTPKSSSVSKANVWNITAGAWAENTFNWNGLGGLTFSLFDVFFDLPTVPAGSVASLDVTDMVTLGGLVTIGISTDSLSDISFASREFATTSQRPVLEVWTH